MKHPWKTLGPAYYDAAHLGSLPCYQQQASLNNCFDEVLRAPVDSEATVTTLVFSLVPNPLTCVFILDSTFLELNPINLRHRQDFKACKKEGQLVIREELLSLIKEYGRGNIGVDDML